MNRKILTQKILFIRLIAESIERIDKDVRATKIKKICNEVLNSLKEGGEKNESN